MQYCGLDCHLQELGNSDFIPHFFLHQDLLEMYHSNIIRESEMSVLIADSTLLTYNMESDINMESTSLGVILFAAGLLL